MQLIDAGMIAFAAWHALKKKVEYPLAFQVPRMLRKMVADAEDTYALFWNAERLWKRERWPAYRNRPEIWDEAGRADFDAMLIVLNGLGAVQYRADGREADELLAAVAHTLEGSEPLVIRSDDKDFMQLLTESTAMIGRVRGTVRAADVREKLGVTPDYVADYLALTGDQADGIPKIVTPSTARKLLDEHGHVVEWIDRDIPATAGVKQKLDEGRDQLRLNLELVDLSASAVGEPPPPLDDGWGDVEMVRAVGEKANITYLTEASLEEEYADLRQWGVRSRAQLVSNSRR